MPTIKITSYSLDLLNLPKLATASQEVNDFDVQFRDH